ncbi:glucan biosynthesis protein D [Herbaspirillum sp. LeCh32-8]|uniref:glucan biosynthesis protein n=1 Tax=Herbaspirillum sp. LeCh32-8 TaxID=2821356 RepID=UPI001AE8E2CA|nr:glucan biosynthesis protein D [Herbaspirillum sp. LeCh32-8]MBP0599989.1 glucan biosynthesis protein D [Herbaspirillum sp. LeCh32-8]
MPDRRRFLASATAAAALAALGIPPEALAAARMKMGSAERFSFEALIARARDMAKTPYRPYDKASREILDQIDYEAHGKIKFNTDYAPFADGPGQFPLTFFHLGKFFRVPVRMFVLDGAGDSSPGATRAREILYDDHYFDMPADSPAHQLPPGSGFAGFRFQESRRADQQKKDWRKNDWVAFLGASYFRAIGDLYQYGLSARGIAIDVAEAGKQEEFPDFTQFFFEPAAPGSDTVVVYALLEGPSVTGAYKFTMRRARGVTMEIDKSLFLRRDVARLGLAPATSMYWFSETVKGAGVDWRPEVHDSDGLAIWGGNGEHIWRPLNNPPRTMASSFADSDLRGFGLLQRDRDFDHYQDGVLYDRRPSLWVEPLEGWGDGAVQLIELRTDDEIHDNIVAMWVPKARASAGSAYRLRYRLYWQKDEPFPSSLARCVATRLGNGGQPGQPRPPNVRKFMVEFKGAPLEKLPYGARPEAVLSASRGSFSYVFTEPVPNGVPGHWRAQFDLTVEGEEPVDLRLFLREQGQALSETWLFQYHPFRTSPVY